jgi:DNA invertase Pin-like site-specific DNA recombinase
MSDQEIRTTTTAVGYCRVSTDGQGERGYGLAAQREVIDAEVAKQGWDLAECYVDVASGKTTRRRPELARALLELEAGHAQVLIVAKLDRLSRSLLDFAGLMATAQEQGWGIVALDIGVDTSTINGELVANIIMALAQWERRIIGARTKDALAEVVAQGGRLGRPASTAPDAEAVVRVMRRQGASYGAVAKALNTEGLPTAQGGAQWHASTVRALCQRLQVA